MIFCFAKGHRAILFLGAILTSFISFTSNSIQVCQTKPEFGFYYYFCSASSQIAQPLGVKLYDDKKSSILDSIPPKVAVTVPIIAEPKSEEKIDWAKLGLNAQTKEKLPIAVVKENATDVDHGIRNKLTEKLHEDGFNVVDESEAALRIVISQVNVKAELAGKPFQGTIYAQHNGTAIFNLKAVWTKAGSLLFEQQFNGRIATNNNDTAKETARKEALKQAEEKILTFVQ